MKRMYGVVLLALSESSNENGLIEQYLDAVNHDERRCDTTSHKGDVSKSASSEDQVIYFFIPFWAVCRMLQKQKQKKQEN